MRSHSVKVLRARGRCRLSARRNGPASLYKRTLVFPQNTLSFIHSLIQSVIHSFDARWQLPGRSAPVSFAAIDIHHRSVPDLKRYNESRSRGSRPFAGIRSCVAAFRP